MGAKRVMDYPGDNSEPDTFIALYRIAIDFSINPDKMMFLAKISLTLAAQKDFDRLPLVIKQRVAEISIGLQDGPMSAEQSD